jgi:squalene synthase HpnC
MALLSPPDTGSPGAASLTDATAACEALARTHYENFTVVSWLLPRRLRPHFRVVYAYCRSVDDLGDEGAADGRIERLDAFAAELDRAYCGTPTTPLFQALQPTIRQFDLEREQLERLITANRLDQGSGRFPTYADLLHYCDHSATPVGRLVLQLLGHRDDERVRRSDATCTGLQLANFWQDVAVDLRKGRIYLPLDDLERFGYTEQDLAHQTCDDRWRALMRFEVARARALFNAGFPLRDMVQGRVRLDLTLFSRGGMWVLDAIERNGYDVFRRRPTLSKWGKAKLALGSVAELTVHNPLWWIG